MKIDLRHVSAKDFSTLAGMIKEIETFFSCRQQKIAISAKQPSTKPARPLSR